jgi:hypothetical protein
MQPGPVPASSAAARPGLLAAGAAGGLLAALASIRMLSTASASTGLATVLADILVVAGLVALRARAAARGWRAAATCLAASVLVSGASLASPRVGVGPISDLAGTASWLADAVAYAVVGGTMLRRRREIRPWVGVTAGAASLARAGAATLLAAAGPFEASLGLPDFTLFRLWAAAATAAGLALAGVFVAAWRRGPSELPPR